MTETRTRGDARLVPQPLAEVLERIAVWWPPLAVAGVVAWLWGVGIPSSGEAGYWEQLGAFGVLGLYLLGWLLSFRWPMVGGTVMAFAAVGVGILASLEHRPARAFVLTIVLFAPAFLRWLVWQRTRPLPAVAALAVLLALLLGTGGWAAARIWDHFYGPQHPSSPLEAGPATPVRWIWSGAVTPTAATIVASLREADGNVRLAVSSTPALRAATFVAAERVADDPEVARFPVTGLVPDSTYHYAVEVGGVLDRDKAGTFRTTVDGPASFTFAFGSCSRLGSNGAVYDAIREVDPRLVLLTGDWFYADISADDPDAFRAAYDTTLAAPAQAALYRSVPIAYVWDDHDFGPNDANRTAASRPAAMAVYRARVPHYPLVGDDSPIFQAFTIGRVRFVLTDGRSARDPDGDTDGPDKTMLGEEQLAWLEDELVASSRTHQLVVLVTNVPWITPAQAGADHWGGFAWERRGIADLIARRGITNLLMLAGDAHMVAIDDGSHTNFSTAGEGFPLMHAAALDRPGSEKGGPYSEGAYPGPGQFGTVEVDDDGEGPLRVTLRGLTWERDELVSYSFSPSAPR